MTVEIEKIYSVVGGVQAKLVTSDGRTFFLKVDRDGLAFHDKQSRSGTLEGSPVRKSADEIFAWIADENPGGKKKFKDKIGVKPRRSVEPAPRAKMPRFRTAKST